MGITYKETGVDYDLMDPFKLMAQRAALETAGNIARLGFSEVTESRGESAYLIDMGDHYLALVGESLGTKIRVADAMYELTGKLYYNQVSQCAVAMVVNDLITLGALPLSVVMLLSVGTSEWFNNEARYQNLIDGWRDACTLAGCTWGGGETPTLKGIVVPGTAVLSGSAIGFIRPKEQLIKGNIQDGDAMVFIESSGIHANGLTLARSIAERKDSFWRKLFRWLPWVKSKELPDGYLTPVEGDGRPYGEVLLDPTIIYVRFIEACLNKGVDIHYAVNITGHGWRKLMRGRGSFNYIVEWVPKPPAVFQFIQKHGPVSDREAYATFNMGAGFAVYVPPDQAARVISIAREHGLDAWYGGHIESNEEGNKMVIIQPKQIIYRASELGVR